MSANFFGWDACYKKGWGFWTITKLYLVKWRSRQQGCQSSQFFHVSSVLSCNLLSSLEQVLFLTCHIFFSFSQYDFFMAKAVVGQEDCLVLNVYVPGKVKPRKDGHLLPVMYFIHGGGFFLGSGSSDFFGPERFLDYDVVSYWQNNCLITLVVSISYFFSILSSFLHSGIYYFKFSCFPFYSGDVTVSQKTSKWNSV